MVRRAKTPIALFVALAMLVVPFAGCGGSSQPTAPSVRHFVVYKGAGWKGVLVVNGIPVELLLLPENIYSITEWTQTGTNTVTVVVESDYSTQAPFQFQVFSGEKADGSDRKELGPPVAIPVPAAPETTAASTSFTAPPRADWPWKNAATLTQLTPQDQQEITAVFQRFCNAFATKNTEEVLSVFSTGSAIRSQAAGISLEQARKNDSDFLQQIFATSGQMYVIHPDEAQVRPFERGVMIFPTVLDGSRHLLYMENKADPARSPVFDFITLCKIDGRWVRVN